MIASFFKKRIVDVFKTTRLNFRTLPTDLDYYLHMNNSKYFTYGEACRMDFMIRSGFLNLSLKKGYYGPIAFQEADFKKPLKLFQKFTVESSAKIIDEKWFEFEHIFLSPQRETIATVKARIVVKKKNKTIPTHVIIEELNKQREDR